MTVSAANPAATAGAAAHPASCNPDGNQLGTADLRRFLEQHGIAAAVVPALEGAPPPPGCVEVKSLVYLLGTQPLVLVLPLAARVDERQVAALLHVGRNRVRMAPAGSLIDLCGYSGKSLWARGFGWDASAAVAGLWVLQCVRCCCCGASLAAWTGLTGGCRCPNRPFLQWETYLPSATGHGSP